MTDHMGTAPSRRLSKPAADGGLADRQARTSEGDRDAAAPAAQQPQSQPQSPQSPQSLQPPPAQQPRAQAAGQVRFDAGEALVLAHQARAALADAALEIDSEVMLAIAARDLKAVKALQQQVEERRTAITRPLNEALKLVNDLFRVPKAYLDDAERQLKDAMVRYTSAQQAKALAARQAAEAAARAERERLEAQQREDERRAREAALAAQEAQRAAARAAAQGDEAAAERAQQAAREFAAISQAAQLDAQEAAAATQVTTVPTSVAAPAPIAGISSRVTYAVEVIDLGALVSAVAHGQAPREALKPDEKFLAAQARAFKRAGLLYPGVQVSARRGLAARAE